MSDTPEIANEAPAAPKKKAKPKKKQAKRAAPKPAAVAKFDAGEFEGVTPTLCCKACTEERCVISTVGVCKHPMKTTDSGCGPITLRNRDAVKKILKHQAAER